MVTTDNLHAPAQPPGFGKQHLYRRHRPEETSLYPLIEANLDTFLEHLRERDAPLPRFVIDEFREYLRCGRLEHGFVRVKCDGCRHEHLAEPAACFLVQVPRLLPVVRCPPDGRDIRAPHRPCLAGGAGPPSFIRCGCCRSPGRFGFSCRPARRCATPDVTRVLAIVVRAIESSLIRRAGLTRKGGASGGVVTLIQRFGSAVNFNLHLHMVALDGVYARDGDVPRFHEVSAPSSTDMYRVIEAFVGRVLRCLERDGLLIRDPEQPWLDLASRDALDALGAASIQYRIAVGPHAGRKALTLKLAAPKPLSTAPKPFTVPRDGFSLNAAVAFAADQREGIERLCRYVPGPRAGPALALERLSTNGAGQVI